MRSKLFSNLCRSALYAALPILLMGADKADYPTVPGNYVLSDETRAYFARSYDPRTIFKEKASVAMVEADIGMSSAPEDDALDFYGKDGRVYKGYVDMGALPFWILASYVQHAGDTQCAYFWIDGLKPYFLFDGWSPENIPDFKPLPLSQSEELEAVVRDCGKGFEIVNREAYEKSIFSEGFDSPYLNGGKPDVSADVPIGLARDYVRRLLSGFGGTAAVQAEFANGECKQYFDYLFAFTPLKAALTAAGIKREICRAPPLNPRSGSASRPQN